MTDKLKTSPDFILESSWEVCNKVGGIYTVLSTRAKILSEEYNDNLIFIGPDVWKGHKNQFFTEDKKLLKKWITYAKNKENLSLRIGRWNIPGSPIAVLVDFTSFYAEKNEIFAKMWNDFSVNSLNGYNDYNEASMFSYATGKVVESFYNYNVKNNETVIYHCNEWMTGIGALYVRKNVPNVATIFTTHATTIGRSIAGNDKPLYNDLNNYNGDQMAWELNVEAKHSVEKQTAMYVDCFTTVSDITKRECEQLLEKSVDVVTENGFEDSFVPKSKSLQIKRKEAKDCLIRIANLLLGTKLSENTFIITTSGRYEFRNKGIDVFIDALSRVNKEDIDRDILAVIEVPAHVLCAREDLKERIKSGKEYTDPLENPYLTHWLHETNSDRSLMMMKHLGLNNSLSDKVKIIFVPCYLHGNDGIFNKEYYDLLVGSDLTIYPSYYEPWGYTPLESVAFKIPTITTSLSGFGAWVSSMKGHRGIVDGVEVVERDDYNYNLVCDKTKSTIMELIKMSDMDFEKVRDNAQKISKKALWKKFIKQYHKAYDIAIEKMRKRLENNTK